MAFVVGYTTSKMMKPICGYNLIEGTANSRPCSANEVLIDAVVFSSGNDDVWRNECNSYVKKEDCLMTTVPKIPEWAKTRDPHKCIWKQN